MRRPGPGGAVASFDVFDTVLTRLVGDPHHVHHLAGRRLRATGVVDVSPAAYMAAWEGSDRDLCARAGHHVPLSGIAVETAHRLGLPPSAAALLAEAELQVEREVCRSVPGAPRRLAAARRRTGRGIVFVSDTPLPEDFLEELLASHGLWRDGDRLYASADRAAGKDTGELFDVVARDLGEAPRRFLHVGDNRRSDVARARLRGWAAMHEAAASLNAHERRLVEASAVTDGLASRLAGAGRLGRLEAVEQGVDPALAALSSGVGFPLLAGFGLWVLRQALVLELDRLYFLARDGAVLLDVTAALAKAAAASPSCHYLRGSRLAWNLPSTATSSDRDRDDWLHDEREQPVVSARLKLARVGVTPEEARRLVDSPLLRPEHAERNLSAGEQQELYDLLARGPLAEELERRAVEQRDLMLRYLDQEGVTAPGRVGVVDIGWRGRVNRSLEEVLREGGRPLPAAHLFMALLEDAPQLMGADLYGRSHAWLFDEGRGRGVQRVRNRDIVMAETFTKSDEPYTAGYAAIDDRVEPVLVEPADAADIRAVVSGFRTTLSLAVGALVDGGALDGGVDLRAVAWQQLLAFWRHPSRAEAATWGRLPWSEDYDGTDHTPLAGPLHARDVLAGLRAEGLGWRPRSLWRAATTVLSHEPLRSAQRLVAVGQARAGLARRAPDRLRRKAALYLPRVGVTGRRPGTAAGIRR